MNLSQAVQSFLESVGAVSKDSSSDSSCSWWGSVFPRKSPNAKSGQCCAKSQKENCAPYPVFCKITAGRQHGQTRRFCLSYKNWAKLSSVRHCSSVWHLLLLFFFPLPVSGENEVTHLTVTVPGTPVILQPRASSFLGVFPLIQNMSKSMKIHAAR